MIISVGLLYSSQEFLELIKDGNIYASDFENIGKRFVLAPPRDIFSISLRCAWITLNDMGICILTDRGRELIKASSPDQMLRHQLRDIIDIYQPPWSMKIRSGRAEIRKFLPEDINQIFSEANLFVDWTDEVIEWWDSLAEKVRSEVNARLLRNARLAERLSVRYEKERTGKEPHWQSIESNYSGYDILSIYENNDFRKVQIEVKSSELNMNDAYFTVSRNEWRVATIAEFYRFHLWVLKGRRKLIVLDSNEVEEHIPLDRGEGRWEQVRIPFRYFRQRAEELYN